MKKRPNKSSTIPGVLLVDRREIEELLSMDEALKVVENAFKLEAEGKTIMPPKSYLDLREYKGDFRTMPGYIDGSVGIKWVSVYPDNGRYNLPTNKFLGGEVKCVTADLLYSSNDAAEICWKRPALHFQWSRKETL